MQASARLELVGALGYSQEVVDTLVQSSAYSQLEGEKDAVEMFADFGLAWWSLMPLCNRLHQELFWGAMCLEGQLRHLLHRPKGRCNKM